MVYKTILILGGTGDAVALSHSISTKFPKLKLIVSLAGKTNNPSQISGNLITGGFGGKDGLRDFITQSGIDLVIDATHPFATMISKNATLACDQAKIKRTVLLRPKWVLPPKASWTEVKNLSEAAVKINKKKFSRVFLTTGVKNLNTFENLQRVWFLIRVIQNPELPIRIKNHTLIISRPPFNFEHEHDILLKNKIDCLICKNSGGEATKPKLMAALQLKIPIILIRRPKEPSGFHFQTIDECMRWLTIKC